MKYQRNQSEQEWSEEGWWFVLCLRIGNNRGNVLIIIRNSVFFKVELRLPVTLFILCKNSVCTVTHLKKCFFSHGVDSSQLLNDCPPKKLAKIWVRSCKHRYPYTSRILPWIPYLCVLIICYIGNIHITPPCIREWNKSTFWSQNFS